MAKYRVTADTAAVRSTATLAPDNIIDRFVKDNEFEGVLAGEQSPFIKISDPRPPGPNAYVLLNSVQEVSAAVQEPIDSEAYGAFCALVTLAASKHGPDRDYLMAAAYCGSKNLTDFGGVGAARIGPFQITEQEWKEAITTGVAKNMGYTEADRFLWYRQPEVAALRAAECCKALQTDLGRSATFAELYFAQLFGAGAAAILKRPRTDRCEDAIHGPAVAGSYAVELAASNATIGQVLRCLQKCLKAGFAEALKVIDAQPPVIRFIHQDDQIPPWLEVAREELKRGVAEVPGERDSEQIKGYHAAAGLTAQGDETAWCGSFATFCMATSSDPAVSASVATGGSARASWWKEWGVEAADPMRLGTVIVLRPQVAGSSGHVGFLEEGSTETDVNLLAGNQGGTYGKPDHVGIISFKATEVVARRWMNVAGKPATVGGLDANRLYREGVEAGSVDALFVAKAPRVMKSLLADLPGLTQEQAAGILGNIGYECGGFHQLHQLHMPEGRGGYGWCQWDGPRRDAFLAYAHDKGLDWQGDDANYGYLIQELKGSEASALVATMKQNSLQGAVIEFDRTFERSGKKHLPSRVRYATLALAAYRKSLG